jgi:hypothetical protein
MRIDTNMRRNIMPQLHFYVPDDVAEQIKARAARAHLSISRYVADLVKRDIVQSWPEDYFEQISGAAEGATIRYESSGPPAERLPLE